MPSVPTVSLVEAAKSVFEFEHGSLTRRLAELERLFRNADRKHAHRLCTSHGVHAALLQAALDLKKFAGQVNVTIHAVGILAALPSILEKSEMIQSLSLGAGNTGRAFDLETNRRVAEFKFIRWRGGPESIRQNSLFKDFYCLAEARTSKARYLYLLELERPLKFLRGNRDLASVMSRNAGLAKDFRRQFPNRFRVVRDYYMYRRRRVRLVDLSQILPALGIGKTERHRDCPHQKVPVPSR